MQKNKKIIFLNGHPFNSEATPSKMSTQASSMKSQTTTGEAAIATKKIIVKKPLNDETVTRLINLNGVSATCPVINLRRNDHNLLYLKANELSLKALENRDRIRRYLRENHV